MKLPSTAELLLKADWERPVNDRKPWSASEVQQLKDLVSAGISDREIGRKLDRTANAVKNMCRKQHMIRTESMRRNWTVAELNQVKLLGSAGMTVEEVAHAINRTVPVTRKAGLDLGIVWCLSERAVRRASIPERIACSRVIAVEIPKRYRKVLLRCDDSGIERWIQLAPAKLLSPLCRKCATTKRTKARPLFSIGDTVGHFTVTAVLVPDSGGYRYRFMDSRCGHEGTSKDTPRQPFKGHRTLCGCPIRNMNGDGYVTWSWHYPARKKIIVMEHRIIMEQTLGREMFPDENVHHINGARDDNRIENLELWSNSQPSGQRVEDKVAWAASFLARYGREVK